MRDAGAGSSAHEIPCSATALVVDGRVFERRGAPLSGSGTPDRHESTARSL